MNQAAIRRFVDSQHPLHLQTTMPAVAKQRGRWLPALALAVLAAATVPGIARAAVNVRVESRPISNPIKVYVTVTDSNGQPQGGLSVNDFTVTLDGNPISFQPADFSLPPVQNPSKNVSVVFAMDYSPSTEGAPRIAMQEAVVDFINAMAPGDYAAIVKFNGTQGASLVQPFTEIDGAAGSSMLVSSAMAPYPGSSTNVFDAIILALGQFSALSLTLPDGPRAVIVISDGEDNTSVATLNSVIDAAGSDGIPVFSISLPNANSSGRNVLNALAARTGGAYIQATDTAAVTAAYGTISSLLNNGYLLTFQSSISDCNQHTLQVTVTGHNAVSVKFTRCDAVTQPLPPPKSGGGGGALGVPELLAGLVALVARRRRRALADRVAQALH